MWRLIPTRRLSSSSSNRSNRSNRSKAIRGSTTTSTTTTKTKTTSSHLSRFVSSDASSPPAAPPPSSPPLVPHDYEGEWTGCRRDFMAPILIPFRSGAEVLTNPLFNKGTAFKTGERDRLRFRGLLPHKVMNIHKQKERFLLALRDLTSNISKNLMLEDLHDRNETLYHRVLVDHIEEMAPYVYTPTVGQACQEFGTRFRRPRGMYFTEDDRGQMASMVYHWPHKDVHVIVVTDGSRILGLGDLGANGMGIPIGKLSLYCAAGGIAPHRVLPVVLDVGTDNEELLQDPFYLGVSQKRLRGPAYFALVDEFMEAVRYRWPNVLVQFEDFDSRVAQTILDKYRHKHLCFNDDIQGTGATALAGLLGALRAKGQPVDSLGDERILIAGAGSAGIGIAQVLKQAMMEQGCTEEKAQNTLYVVDQYGLLGKERLESLTPEQRIFARNDDSGLSLQNVIDKYHPTILIGVTAFGGLFTEELIRSMAKHVERPIVFPLSNPTTKAECTAEQAYEWTDGRCIFASGSPFDPVVMKGQTYFPSQCNNMYVFPGVGLGASVCGAKRVTDRMLYIAAKALAECVPDDVMARGQVFPHISTIRQVSHKIAVAVVQEAMREGIATKVSAEDAEDLDTFVVRKMYYPEYVPLVEKTSV